MVNYEVEPSLLQPYVPKGTTLDSWNGKTLVSIVGFLFLDTRLKGIPVPFHRNFEEVNLRFYVKRVMDGEIRRGVVFVKEIVPLWGLARIARSVYNENYVSMPMRHSIIDDGRHGHPELVSYGWCHARRWNELRIQPSAPSFLPAADSEEAFITEHYWGYVGQQDGSTIEYGVEHPQWQVWKVANQKFDCDIEAVYGKRFVEPLSETPSSAFLAKGSMVVVRIGTRI